MFERKTQLASLILAAILLPFCGGKAQSSGSSESHFLKPCGEGCKGGLECVCGVCTEPCNAGTACGDLGVASSVCSTGASDSSCSQSFCDVLCDNDGDCSAMGGGFSCQGGRCRTAQTSCDAAEAQVAAFVNAAKDCATDDDCVQVDSSCYTRETCAGSIAINKSHDDAELNRRLDALSACRSECSVCLLLPPPAACVAGKCQLGGGAAQTCDERANEAATAVAAAVNAASRKCLIDSDCVEVDNSSDCHASCGAIVAKVDAPSIASTIEGLNTGLCATFEADGCKTIIPPCVSPGTPACIDQTCVSGFCGDGACTSSENAATCPADCTCGDGVCSEGEAVQGCPADCTRCGDAMCTGNETPATCPEDCGFCGDGKCNQGESSASCPADCVQRTP